mgnify:FL=1
MNAHHVGAALSGCNWVGIPFVGGFSEVPHIVARTIVCNDLNRHVINLARVVASDSLRPDLIRKLRRKAFHSDELKLAQQLCRDHEPNGEADLDMAEQYFVCCWMNRASKAGIDDEFNGRPAIRWNADGGDSMVRFQSAIRMLGTFSKTLRRCTFETMDAFDFLARCEDVKGGAVYCDPPFPGVGRRYKHNAGQTDAEERAWHARLRDALERFQLTRCVCRFYAHPLIDTLYSNWERQELTGRTQANNEAPEILLVRNDGGKARLFA